VAAHGSHIFLAVHLRGEIRHSEQTSGDRLRIGTQFVDLSDAERDYLASLTEIQARW
jgi:hypothetical protein